MKELIERYIPNAPGLGLYVRPNIPDDKLRNALSDYAPAVRPAEVVALYDATLFGSAKDGAVFTEDRIVFQNTDLHPGQEMRYDDIVGVSSKKRLLGGMKVLVDHNPGQATVTHTIDFSGKGEAAAYVVRFLQEVMMAQAGDGDEPPESADQAPEAKESEGHRNGSGLRRSRARGSRGDGTPVACGLQQDDGRAGRLSGSRPAIVFQRRSCRRPLSGQSMHRGSERDRFV